MGAVLLDFPSRLSRYDPPGHCAKEDRRKRSKAKNKKKKYAPKEKNETQIGSEGYQLRTAGRGHRVLCWLCACFFMRSDPLEFTAAQETSIFRLFW